MSRPRLESYREPLLPFSVLPFAEARPPTVSEEVIVERFTTPVSFPPFLLDLGRAGGFFLFKGEGVCREFAVCDLVLILTGVLW